MLNQKNGFKGICGLNDMREVQKLAEAGNKQAQLAIDMYCYRIKKYIDGYCAVLGTVDALLFTAGIGENSAGIRELSCQGLSSLGIVLDSKKNRRQSDGPVEIQADTSALKILVIPTDEELQIAQQTLALIQSREKAQK